MLPFTSYFSRTCAWKTVSRVGKLDWNVRTILKTAYLGPGLQQFQHQLIPHSERQELVEHDPLIMPAYHPGGPVEYSSGFVPPARNLSTTRL